MFQPGRSFTTSLTKFVPIKPQQPVTSRFMGGNVENLAKTVGEFSIFDCQKEKKQ
jgi:hypothetical protein